LVHIFFFGIVVIVASRRRDLTHLFITLWDSLACGKSQQLNSPAAEQNTENREEMLTLLFRHYVMGISTP